MEKALKIKILAAFMIIYVVYGSTYIAIHFAMETLPPFLLAGTRFTVAGILLYLWAKLRGAERPTAKQWQDAAVVGVLLFVTGNAAVVYAQQTVPSGIASLVITLVPVWMVLFDWVTKGKPQRPAVVILGLILGFSGVFILLRPAIELGVNAIDPLGACVLLGASLSWACGSLYLRQAEFPKSADLTASMQMLIGGTVLILVSALTQEYTRIDLALVSHNSILGVSYLIVIGSLVGFRTYSWLLRTVSVASVSTYAFVNPVVAVFLGCVLAKEPLTSNVIYGACAIVLGVALLVTNKMRPIKRMS